MQPIEQLLFEVTFFAISAIIAVRVISDIGNAIVDLFYWLVKSIAKAIVWLITRILVGLIYSIYCVVKFAVQVIYCVIIYPILMILHYYFVTPFVVISGRKPKSASA